MNLKTKFIIIVPFFNVERWIKKCIKSILLQDYEEYECYLIDDISSDNSAGIVENIILDNSKFHLIKNSQKAFALKNIYDSIETSGTSPEEVIVTLDGDDFFATKSVLTKLNEVYQKYQCLMTYGSYMEFPSMQKGAFCKQIPSSIIKDSLYRESEWMSSHLRTFKRSLWNQIDKTDLLDDDGSFYRMTWDMAFMFPMLEMAGPLALHIPEILYMYNRENPINDDKTNHSLQLITEHKIRKKQRYSNEFVSCNILGPGEANSGLGNQLFCIANALSYAKDNEKIPYFPQIDTDLQINKYKNILYKNLNLGLDINIFHNTYNEPQFSYSTIPNLSGNVFLNGYFQSEKYFVHNRQYILEILSIEEKQKEVAQKYGDFSDHISIHIRRGDYEKLQDYHGLLDIEYYRTAINYLGNQEKYIIFSDDIEWCKKHLTFIENVVYSKCIEDWEDLLLMSTCKHNIIANSTFSWWSAWINQHQNKTVIAPKRWFSLNVDIQHDLINCKWKVI